MAAFLAAAPRGWQRSSHQTVHLRPLSARAGVVAGSAARCCTASAIPAAAAAMLLSASVANRIEQVSDRRVSSSTAVFLLGCALSTCGIAPASSAAYTAVQSHLMPLGVVAMFLAQRAIEKRDLVLYRRNIVAFALGAIGTVLGSLVAARVVTIPSSSAAALGAKLAAVFCATYVGGSVNFFATAAAVELDQTSLAAALSADMLLMGAYFTALFAAAASKRLHSFYNPSMTKKPEAAAVTVREQDLQAELLPFSASQFAWSLMDACAVASFLAWVGSLAPFAGGHLLVSSSLAFILTQVLSAAGAHSSERLVEWRHALQRGSTVLSETILLCFFFTLGASVRLQHAVTQSRAYAAFAALILLIHAVVILVAGRALRIPLRELLVASNANVGGSATAAAMASNLQWHDLVAPAVLSGTLGYGIGNALGLAVYQLLLLNAS
ncbi:putative membrane protein YjcL [Porphyridium purpureum]|uniref:Putative membrane protein YjcL n=1 Tax=Porphyridium purpureum TaxID=35688 RepID=A0A5J4Z3P7_PORPP|nr:putative membrane protein YjcL [Porphyridium purpureum]|eukprot:POR6235..scf295_1